MRILLILFLTVPLIEIYLLIQVGSMLGALATVGLIVLTALLGAVLLRMQGFATMQRVRQALSRGEIPAIEMFEGVVLLFCGALLLTPGFFTDILGFLGLLPLLRRSLILWIMSKGLFKRGVKFNAGRPAADPAAHQPPPGKNSANRNQRIIEGQFWREDD